MELSSDCEDFLSYAQSLNNDALISSDFFDTLVFRDVVSPVSIFSKLYSTEEFSEKGITPVLRARCEANIRAKKMKLNKTSEVSLFEIYQEVLEQICYPIELRQNTAILLSEMEFSVELENCQINYEVYQVLFQLHSKGLDVVITSDTYFNSMQLHKIFITACKRQEITAFIKEDKFFTSVSNGISKSRGLLKLVALACDKDISQLVHFGDNFIADVGATVSLGAAGFHYNAFFDKQSENRRNTINLSKIFFEEKSQINHDDDFSKIIDTQAFASLTKYSAPATVVNSLARVYIYFAQQISAYAYQKNAKKVLFMLRDGYLAQELYDLINQTNQTPTETFELSVSRYASVLVSFEDYGAIIDYREELFRLTGSEEQVDAEIEKILADYAEIFCESSKKGNTQNDLLLIIGQYVRENFIKHFEEMYSPQPGENILLVDLGYAGSIHKKIAPILEDRFDIKIFSFFLVSKNIECFSNISACFDPKIGQNVCESILRLIAPLEQFSMKLVASNHGYKKNHPFSREAIFAPGQKEKIEKIQSSVLNCARVYISLSSWRKELVSRSECARELIRLIFAPTSDELKFVGELFHDVNFGSDGWAKVGDEGLQTDYSINPIMNKLDVARNSNYFKPTSYPVFVTQLAGIAKSLDFRISNFSIVGNLGSFSHISVNGDKLIRPLVYETEHGFINLDFAVTKDCMALGWAPCEAINMIQIEEISVDDVKKYQTGVINKTHLVDDLMVDGGHIVDSRYFFRSAKNLLLMLPLTNVLRSLNADACVRITCRVTHERSYR